MDTPSFPLYVNGVFLDVQGQITPYSVVRSGRNSNSSEILCMSSLPTNFRWTSEREKVVTSILDAQGQLTVRYSRNSHSDKLLCMFSLLASMKTTQSKTAEKKRQHCFPHYKLIVIFLDAQGHLIPQSMVGSGRT